MLTFSTKPKLAAVIMDP